MKINEWLNATQDILSQAGVGTARLDSLVLLSDIIDKDKSWILAHPEYVLQRSEIGILSTKVAQRAKHTPIAYIRGKTEFYGREFAVNENVLVPRPESEAILDLLKKVISGHKTTTIIDIGTGSGALAISAKLEFPAANVIASDIDSSCIDLAKKNANKLCAEIEFVIGDLLQPFQNPEFSIQDTIFICNLPYVPAAYPINEAAMHEPKLALFSGTDGLDHYVRLFAQLSELHQSAQYIITESLPMQHNQLADIASRSGYKLTDSDGLTQLFSYTTNLPSAA